MPSHSIAHKCFKAFKQEFGIHFKDSESELELVKGFLEEWFERHARALED